MPEPGQRVQSNAAEQDNEGPPAQGASDTVEDLEALRQRAAVAEEERDEYLALLQRTKADFENFQKRTHRDRADERRHAHGAFAKELLPVLHNLQRALDAARTEGAADPLVQGVSLVHAQALDVFRRFGIELIDPLGQPFDPMLHEAVLKESRADVAPGTVIEVLEPGYRLHERVLRPAKVAVSV